MVQRAGFAIERREEMDRVEDHRLSRQGTFMSGDHLTLRHDHNAIHISLDRHHLEGIPAWHAVAVAVESDALILVDGDRGLDHTGVEPVRRQRCRRGEVFGEAVLDRERPSQGLHDAVVLGFATLAKERVQFRKIVDARHGCGEPPLHGLDGPFGVGLFVAARRHAAVRGEDIVTGHRRVSRLKLAFAPQQNRRGYGPRIVPPNLLGHGAKELESCDHSFKDRLGAFEGKGEHKRSVGVSPGRDQERYEPAAVGEIDVDVAEIGFEALTGEMSQRDNRFLMLASMLLNVALDLSIAATVIVLVAETAKELSGGVPLFGRGGLVVDQDLIDDSFDRP